MLNFEHVSKFAISELSLHIPKGVMVGIIGASGAGKTTLLRLACGLLEPEEGSIYTFGKNPMEYRAILGKRSGCLLERMPVLDAWKSVKDNFQELKIVHRMPEAEFLREYEALAKRFGFFEYEQELVKTLSFGQRRRVELAAVLLHRPELVLLDEASNGLDENAKQILKEQLEERVRAGATVLVTSHAMREVAELCQRIVVLEQGKLLYYGEQAALLRQYAPMDSMKLKFNGAVPDMEDLPLEKYLLDGEEVTLTYNSNYITAAEILAVVLRQTQVREVTIRKPDLADVILAMKSKTVFGVTK